MRAELRRLHSPDVFDLRSFAPPDPGHFGILVQAMIGPENDRGDESFDFIVCSPSWLREEALAHGHVIGRHHLVFNHFDIDAIENVIRTLCASAIGGDWEEVATYLSRFGKWEFEDYQEYIPE